MVKVTVSDPQLEREGRRDQFTTYLVSTDKIAIRRRYSDFQWLYGRLQTELPGAIVPIIPHRMAITNSRKFDPAFVEQRRRHLQFFMDQIVQHEELARAPSMTPFMLDKFGTEFDMGKKKVETTNPTTVTAGELVGDEDDYYKDYNNGNGGGSSSTKAAVQKMSNMFAKAGTLIRVKTGNKELIQTSDEKEIEKIQSRIANIESQVKSLRKSAETLTHMTSQMTTAIGDMNKPITEWRATYQRQQRDRNGGGDDDEICEMMKALMEFSSDYSQLMEHKHREEQVQFDDVMMYLANDVRAFHIALKQRKKWQLACTTRAQQIISKDEQIAKATQNLKPPEVTGKLSFERSELQKLEKAERAKLEECTARFLREAEGSETRLEMQLKKAFAAYAKIQIAYTNRINDAWGQLLPYVDDEHRKGLQLGEDQTEAPPMPPSQPPPPVPNEEPKEDSAGR